MNSLRSYSDLKMDWIPDASPSSSVVLPPVTHPWQDRVFKRIDPHTGEVKSQSELMERGARTIGGNL